MVWTDDPREDRRQAVATEGSRARPGSRSAAALVLERFKRIRQSNSRGLRRLVGPGMLVCGVVPSVCRDEPEHVALRVERDASLWAIAAVSEVLPAAILTVPHLQ